jgi:hypothetical protein
MKARVCPWCNIAVHPAMAGMDDLDFINGGALCTDTLLV